MDNTTLTTSEPLLFFVVFVIHFTTLIFISGIYWFAYKFLGNRFYIPVAIGWLCNAGYIALETILMLIDYGQVNDLSAALITAGVGITPIPFFHWSVLMNSETKEKSTPQSRPFLIGLLLAAVCVGAAFWVSGGTRFPPGWVFAAVTVPAAVYSCIVMLSVAHRFFLMLPETDYGGNSRFLYGAWAAYALIQLFYPFRLFLGPQKLLFLLLFSLSFFIKILSSAALLNMLRESYMTAQTHIREASVLADIGNVAAGLHHDISNPLAWIDSELKILAQKRSADKIVTESIGNIRKPVQLIDSAIKFVSLIRVDPEAIARKFVRIKAKDAVAFATNLYKKKYPNSAVRIVPPPADAPIYYIRANSDLLAEAFVNLLNNAHEAGAKLIRIRIRRVTNPDSNIEISFTNDGRPLTEAERENCLKPGWTQKEKSGDNTNVGMGLYMATKIVDIHRGSLRIDNIEDGVGVEALITLPAAKHVAERDNPRED